MADEDVPSIRSNSAATVCGSDHLLVFGGWSQDNCVPLSACELLHLETLCWTHCSTRGSLEPPPRGNPTLVYSPCNNKAILFGGWDRVRRLDDLWSLDLENWEWTQIKRKLCFDKDGNKESWPRPRTDHSAVLWQKNAKSESMVVYGGSVEGCGTEASGELWFLCCSHKDTMRWRWEKTSVDGPLPPRRTSHTASIVGTGETASMIVLGGTDASKGSGRAGIIDDAWILVNLGITSKRSWINLPWDGPGVGRCRHAINVIGTEVFVWGGWDGECTVNDAITVWSGSLDDFLPNSTGLNQPTSPNKFRSTASATEAITSTPIDRRSRILQERWEAEKPFRQDNLPPKVLERALRSKLPNALVRTLHRHAVLEGKDTYIDPASGYSVFTQLYLKRRSCCGNGCRHCPHGHKNVPNPGGSTDESTSSNSSSSSLATAVPAMDW
eukprot:CAMPEP_0197195822 /NCGR_PEP_ID=MMETSP1423-20130617/31908_1 /TAXON_ID=476441 /ORGANISM="Pseudo-nitzschia heimii, Strain UNC1101" /LENGTH=439 /DNA_ID=CAMNT_0042649567 /DNA_START=190 /DNA_END=1506 /DNA_ORIENTATION=+